MVAILITPQKQAEIAAAIAYAREHVVPWDKFRDTVPDNQAAPTLMLKDRNPDSPKRPPSIRIVFDGSGVEAAISFEEQPAGLVRHLSVSTRDGRRILDPDMFIMVAREFGIDFPSAKPGKSWIEEYEPGCFAINVAVLETERTGPESLQ